MARRVRRDLSNKAIKRSVKDSLKSKKGKSGNVFDLPYFKLIIYFSILVIIIFVTIRIINSFDYQNIISDENLTASADSVNSTKPEQVAENRQNTPAPADQKKDIVKHALKPVPRKVQIEILNGCGVQNIAAIATEYSRKNGLDVVYIGNYMKNQQRNFNVKTSQVIGWVDAAEQTKKIAEILGIDEANIKTEINKDKQLDASVILGADYKSLKPFLN